MDRKRGFLASVVVLSLIGCSTAANLASPAETTLSVDASPIPSIAAAAPTPTAPPSPTPTAPDSNGGADLIVWQMNGTNAEETTASSVFAMDIGTRQKRDLATLPENEDTCCPEVVAVSSDRQKASLFAGRFRGWVDLATGAFSKRPVRVPPVDIALSNDGRRVAWVDLVTGSSPGIVVTDSDGKDPIRLDLPVGTWFARLAWSRDDRVILATAAIKLKKAVGTIILIETERGDPGPLATHLVAVPLDGSPSVDLVDDADAVAADLKTPAPPPPSIDLPNGSNPERTMSQARWSPDGSSVAYVESTCWTEGKTFQTGRRACLSRLLTVDVATRAVDVVVDDMAGISTLAWSPTGREIAFRGDDRKGLVGIFVVDLGTSATGFVASGSGDDFESYENMGSVQWSPDGTWIAFSRTRDAWVMHPDGSAKRMIAPHARAGW